MKVLVVEDEPKFLSFLCKGLEEQGMSVDGVADGNEAFEKATATRYDIICLDIMLPGRDGLSILQGLRETGNDVPVIVLTARSGINERVEGLNLGADDYLPKPFYIEELIARINTVMRRVSGTSSNILEVGDISVNLATRGVLSGETKIDLTNREFSLLEYLMRSPDRVLSRTQICEHVWDYHFDPGTNLVDVYIRRLRNKIDVGGDVSHIETMRGVGYRLLSGEPARDG